MCIVCELLKAAGLVVDDSSEETDDSAAFEEFKAGIKAEFMKDVNATTFPGPPKLVKELTEINQRMLTEFRTVIINVERIPFAAIVKVDEEGFPCGAFTFPKADVTETVFTTLRALEEKRDRDKFNRAMAM